MSSYVLKNVKILGEAMYLRRNLRGFTSHLGYAAVFKDYSSAYGFKKEWYMKHFEPCASTLPSNVHYAYGQYQAEQKDILGFTC